MGRGGAKDEEALPGLAPTELPLVLAGPRVGAYDEPWERGSGVGVGVRNAFGETFQLGVHPSGFGTFLTMNAEARAKAFPYQVPVCGLEPEQQICADAAPCRHRQLYELAMGTPSAGEELMALLERVSALQSAAQKIDERGLNVVSPEGYAIMLLRLDLDTYLVDARAPAAQPDLFGFSCLVDAGSCHTHVSDWTGAGCFGRFAVSSPLARTLVPHFSTTPSPPLAATLSTFRKSFAQGEPCVMTLPSCEIPAELDPPFEESQLRSSNGQLYVRAPGMKDVPLLSLTFDYCLLCASNPVQCAKHPGLAHFITELNALLPD